LDFLHFDAVTYSLKKTSFLPDSSNNAEPAEKTGLRYGIWVVLAVHVLVWCAAYSIATANLDSYADMLETYAWGQHLAWGSAKHPPLFAWVAGLWFAVFPTRDGAYFLLSYLNVALGLLGVYRLAQALRMHSLALPAVMLLCMAFPYSTLAAKFNANSILLSVWPWVAVAWVHSLRHAGRSGWLWSVALGLLSALAMLGKYYSGVFLLSIFLTTLLSREGRQWFVTLKPWIALLVFGLALLPHLLWLREHAFVTAHYVDEQRSQDGSDLKQLYRFAIAPFLYWLLPWLLSAWLLVPGQPSVLQRLRAWPTRLLHSWLPQRWDDTLFWLAVLPWLISLVFGLTGFVTMSLPWAIPIGFAFPLLWLRNLTADQSPPLLRQLLPRLQKKWLIWCILALLASPLLAFNRAETGSLLYYLPRREAAIELLKGWHERHPAQALRWVGGAWAEDALLAFYGDASIQVVPGVPDQFPATVSPLVQWPQQAGLLLCPLGPVHQPDVTDCPQQMQVWLKAHGQSAEPIRITVQKRGLWFPKQIPYAYVAFDYLPAQP